MCTVGQFIFKGERLHFLVLTLGLCLFWGCNNGKDATTGAPSESGSLSFQLAWDTSTRKSDTISRAIDCTTIDVGTITLTLYGSDQAELARGGPWNCEAHSGRVSGIHPASGCTAAILATDPTGAANYRALVSDVEIIGGQETEIGIVEMAAYAIEADAGPEQNLFVGSEVVLDASGSHCLPAAPLLYQWTLISAPLGSTANISAPNAISPRFTTDLVGSYIFSLVVSDGYSSSIPDNVTINAISENNRPLAHAGDDLQMVLGQMAALDGSASSDPDNDPLTHTWTITSRPDNSLADLDEATSVAPGFTPDQIGSYTIQLVVNDGMDDSLPDSIVVTVVNTPPQATISWPLDLSEVYLCDPIELTGSATDDQDGPLPGSSLSWSSNLDGVLGSGTSIALTDLMTLGTHTITLTAVDAHSASGQAEVQIQVYYQRVVDTGQTQSFTNTTGEDSDYLINPFSYIDNGDGTVSDTHTRLMWEQTAGITGGFDLAGAESYCATLTLGGHTDWRVPDRKELVSILGYWNLNPSINTTYFNSFSSSYFSSDECMNISGQALVDFGIGTVWCDMNYNNQQVRCVRGGIAAPYAWTEGLVDNGNGTVSDQLTGLMWQQEEYGDPAQGTACEEIIGYIDSLTWEAAISYCQDLQLGGHDDWRLPSVKELESITYERGLQSIFNRNFFPHACGSYWSSTSYIIDGGNAYYHENYNGQIRFYSKNETRDVKCVRGGQSE